MKKSILLLSSAILLSFQSLSAQTIVKDAQGNYRAVKATKDTTKVVDVNTGKTFTDSKGNTWPVYQTKSGRVYALRVSKSGTKYKQYLEPAKNN